MMKKAFRKTNCGIQCAASVVGKMEKNGPLGGVFDLHGEDDRFGQKTWEKAEAEMQRLALNTALGKGKLHDRDLDAIFAGDLLNQCIGAAYGLKDFNVPYFGLYGACSTIAEGLILSALLVSSGQLSRAAAIASSHNCTAERQYRSPLEYGAQRTPTAQWTVTGAGALVVGGSEESRVLVRGVLPGTVIEKGVKDAANMGAAMAPAAADTILAYLSGGAHPLDSIDRIVTGDLGSMGSALLIKLLENEGVFIREKHLDCGCLLYDPKHSDSHSGGSGCGCSASVLASHFLPALERGELSRILFLSTGALMSPQSTLQKNNILGISHAILIEREKNPC